MNDETTVLPRLKDETETDRLSQERHKGITIGIAVMAAIFVTCALGVGFGALLVRILAL